MASCNQMSIHYQLTNIISNVEGKKASKQLCTDTIPGFLVTEKCKYSVDYMPELIECTFPLVSHNQKDPDRPVVNLDLNENDMNNETL